MLSCRMEGGPLDKRLNAIMSKRDPIMKANYSRFSVQYFGDILRDIGVPDDLRSIANDFGVT